MALLTLLLSPLLVLAGLALAAWVFAAWGSFAVTLMAVGVLAVLQFPRECRHAQWPLPLAALAWSALFWWLLLRWQGQYLSLLIQHAREVGWFGRVGISPPQDIGDFLPLANAVFLLVFALAKGLFIVVGRQLFSPKTARGVPGGIAYALEPGFSRYWVLQPGWLCVRWMAATAALLGFVCLLLAWLASIGELQAEWIPLLPAGWFLVAVELAFWLWGLTGEGGRWRPEFVGDDGKPQPQGEFDGLWRRYRANWPDSWRAAGNRLPSGKD